MSRRFDHCPHCGVSLLGDPIPEEYRAYYGSTTHYRREIMIEIPEVYDGGLYFQCKDCGGAWHRWDENAWQHAKAEPFIQHANRERRQHDVQG